MPVFLAHLSGEIVKSSHNRYYNSLWRNTVSRLFIPAGEIGNDMAQMDLTFVHAPSVYDFREKGAFFGPVSDMVPSTPIFEMYPLGLTTLGEYMERHGIRVKLYNLAGMMLHKPGFDVEKNLARLDSRAFGVDLHWMPHCHGAIEVAKILKRLHPGKKVIMGGLSSTIYHEEIMAYEEVDYVVRGDSTEEPFRRLMERIIAADISKTPIGDLSDIPNLTWRDSTGAVNVNPLSWVPDTMDAISLDYAYPMKSVIRDRDMMSYLPIKDWLSYPVSASLTSRGCKRNCVTCGGSAEAYRNHFCRRKTAWRDPQLLIRDIETIQKHIPGPIFVLNDFLMAGKDYTEEFITGLKGKLRNPIGFEFFGPPEEGEDLYKLLNANLKDWSVEISAESHDDGVRTAFGKGHYTTAELEETIVQALRNGAQRFDLYFMTGIPTQTGASVRETGEYVRHLYDLVDHDPRLLVFTSPMAPFLDPGSRAFDAPEKFGYNLLAKSLDEHRELLLQPSWKQMMNYESHYMDKDEMVEATYQAGLDINRVKGEYGIISKEDAAETEARVIGAREQMRRLDELIAQNPGDSDAAVIQFKSEMKLNESTVAKKSDLNWPHEAKPVHVTSNVGLFAKQVFAMAKGAMKGQAAPSSSDLDYPEQVNGVVSPMYREVEDYVDDADPLHDVVLPELPDLPGEK